MSMRMTDLIQKKKRGQTLTEEEIRWFIAEYVAGTIPDYQVSSLLMAVWFTGMTNAETTALTLAMAHSGDTVDLSAIPGVKVDKHSTGGVADTTTLIVAPLVAACGGKVAKMSGRGLGHTGGTLDKLESIPGFSVAQTMERFTGIVKEYGLSVIGQTQNLVPADKQLYSLRDVTGTIDSIPLIASSIMSKKIASGCDAIVLDVKTGSGAFMKDTDSAVKLAQLMVDIGALAGRKTVALVTDMNQPLGMAVGNALEVQEAIQILRGEGGGDLLTVSRALAEKMLLLAGRYRTADEAREGVLQALHSGSALSSLEQMIRAQGGNPDVVRNPDLLPAAGEVSAVRAGKDGYVGVMDAEKIGGACLLLGAGRTRKEDRIDPAVGIWMAVRSGDAVHSGDVLGWFHVNRTEQLEEAKALFLDAVPIQDSPPGKLPLVHAVIDEAGC